MGDHQYGDCRVDGHGRRRLGGGAFGGTGMPHRDLTPKVLSLLARLVTINQLSSSSRATSSGAGRSSDVNRFSCFGWASLTLLSVTSLCVAGCGQNASAKVSAAAPIPSAKPVERGAVGDGDLRVLLSELASAKACEMVKGQFRPLRAADRPGVVTGVLWIRECKAKNDGTRLTIELSGNGWQWAEQEQKKAGGTFAIRQYVKFGMTATMPGALDMAYDRQDHVLSLWFTPAQAPEVTFSPVGGIDVDSKGAWSSVVGALGSVFAQSPEHLAKGVAKTQGGHELEKQLSDGLSVTIDLCSGLSRFGLGREPKGAMNHPDAGESKRVPIELEQGAITFLGPQIIGPAGFTANVESPTGPVHVDIACRDQAEALAEAYANDRPLPVIKTLASKDIRDKGSVRVAKASCEVSLIARPIGAVTTPLALDWQRPASEIAQSTGGPLIRCERGK